MQSPARVARTYAPRNSARLWCITPLPHATAKSDADIEKVAPFMPIDRRTSVCRVSLALLAVMGSSNFSCASNTPEEPTDASNRESDAGLVVDSGELSRQPPIVTSDWKPMSRDDAQSGSSIEHWVLLWARWFLSQSACQSASDDLDGSLCTLYQDFKLPVFFLGAGEYHTIRTECRIPREKAILVPLVQFVSDLQEFPPDTEFGEFDPQRQANRVFDSMRDLSFNRAAKLENQVLKLEKRVARVEKALRLTCTELECDNKADQYHCAWGTCISSTWCDFPDGCPAPP